MLIRVSYPGYWADGGIFAVLAIETVIIRGCPSWLQQLWVFRDSDGQAYGIPLDKAYEIRPETFF